MWRTTNYTSTRCFVRGGFPSILSNLASIDAVSVSIVPNLLWNEEVVDSIVSNLLWNEEVVDSTLPNLFSKEEVVSSKLFNLIVAEEVYVFIPSIDSVNSFSDVFSFDELNDSKLLSCISVDARKVI